MPSCRGKNVSEPIESWLYRLLAAGLAGLLLSVFTVVLSESWWIFELTTHFRPHYAAGALVLALLALAIKRRRLALLALVLAFPHIVALDSLVKVEAARAAAVEGADRRLTVMTANLLWNNDERAAAVDQILALNPDVVVLQEGVSRWRGELRRLAARYPFSGPGAAETDRRVQVFSRVPLRGARLYYPDGRRFPYLHAVLELDGRAVHLLGVHPPYPTSRELSALRNGYLRAVARHARSLAGPVVVAGDFNITPWSPYFLDLVETGGLRDSAKGRGWLPTWPSWLPLAGIPIDHVLVGPGIAVESLARGVAAGSDHYPLIAELIVR